MGVNNGFKNNEDLIVISKGNKNFFIKISVQNFKILKF